MYNGDTEPCRYKTKRFCITIIHTTSVVMFMVRVRVLFKASMSHLLRNCDVSRTVRHKRQTDSDDDDDDDNDQHLSKHLLVQAVIHATDDLEQVNTLLI